MSAALALPARDFGAVLVAEILRARRSVWVAAYLFDIGFSRDVERRARRVVRLLGEAASDGLDVRLLLAQPGPVSTAVANRATTTYASAFGVAVRTSSREAASHAKLALLDASRCLLGGHNLTHTSLAENEDASVLVVGEGDSVSQAARWFTRAWDEASPVELANTALDGLGPWW